MKYIKKIENFKPIKVNNKKPFKMKKDILRSIIYLQKGIKSDTKRIENEKDIPKRSKLSRDRNMKVKKLKDLTLHKAKQIQHLRDNPIVESVENEKTLLEVLESKDFKEKDILGYIGFEEGEEYDLDYEYDWHTKENIPSYNKHGIDILVKDKDIEDLMGIENGVIMHMVTLDSYWNNYEYYIDDEELDYLGGYLTDEISKKVLQFSKLFKTEIEPEEEGEIKKLFLALGLKDDLDNFAGEMSMENEKAVKKTSEEIINSLPYDIDNVYDKGKFNLKLDFHYENIIEYIKENNIEDEVNTISDFIENVTENDELTYEFEYQHHQHLGDFGDLKNEIERIVEGYINAPHEVIPKIINVDNLDMFKKNIDLAIFSFEYGYGWSEKENLFQIAKKIDGNILQYMKTSEFDEIMKKIGGDDLEAYRDLILKSDMEMFNI